MKKKKYIKVCHQICPEKKENQHCLFPESLFLPNKRWNKSVGGNIFHLIGSKKCMLAGKFQDLLR